MTTHTDKPISEVEAGVPEMLPPMRTDAPRRERPPAGAWLLAAVLGLWVLPKRFGPRLAAAGWRLAIIAGVVSLATGLGMLAYAGITNAVIRYGPAGVASFGIKMPDAVVTPGEAVRAPFAALIVIVHTLPATPQGSRILLAAAIGLPLGLLAATAILMPVAVAGEYLSALFGRCLRLTLWSTTLAIPLGVAMLLLPSVLRGLDVERPALVSGFLFDAPPPSTDWWKVSCIVLLAVFALWWLVVLARSVLRYAGPAVGPAWTGQRPRCRRCGYIIAGLRRREPCPECGVPVSVSMAAQERSNRWSRRNALALSIHTAVRRRSD